jgi:hypothetical protein
MSAGELAALSFDARPREFQLALDAGLPCHAQQMLKDDLPLIQRLSPGQVKPVKERACQAQDLARERAGAYLAGRQVTLVCVQRLRGQIAAWAKACSDLSSYLAEQGALVTSATVRDEVGFRKYLRPAAPANGQQALLVLMADGRVESRKDPEDGEQQYRYQGKLIGAMVGPQLNLEDSYEGLTGWNPVSDTMSMDLLALAAVKRFTARFHEVWSR